MTCFLILITIPIGAVWVCSGWIITGLIPTKDLAFMAGHYLRILFAAPGKRYTQPQDSFNASLLVLLICMSIDIALNYLFIFVLDWGLTGAGPAIVAK